jgi:hypothetical protein
VTGIKANSVNMMQNIEWEIINRVVVGEEVGRNTSAGRVQERVVIHVFVTVDIDVTGP